MTKREVKKGVQQEVGKKVVKKVKSGKKGKEGEKEVTKGGQGGVKKGAHGW